MALANYADSLLFGFQGRVSTEMQAKELREPDTMVLPYALDNQQFFQDVLDVSSVKESVQRPVYGYAFNRVSTSVGSAMTTQPTGPVGTSSQIPLTFVTWSVGFSTYNTTGFDNVMSYASIFDNSAMQAMRLLRTAIRQWLTNQLYTSRTATASPAGGVSNIKNANFNAATNCWEIQGGNTQWAAMQSVMQQAGYGSYKYDAFLDPTLMLGYGYQSAQGVQNATNLAYQFAQTPTMPGPGGYFDNIWQDINLGTTVAIEPEYTNGTALVMPKQSFAFVPWIPKAYTDPNRQQDFFNYNGGYGTIGDDKYRQMEYQLFGWNQQQDTSANYGMQQGQWQNWQIGFTAAFVTSFISNPNETPIYQFAITGA